MVGRGDPATDYNHYTKRAILAAIYADPFAECVSDESAGKAETRAFRLALCRATRNVIARCLDLVGVEAPERM